MTTYENNYWSLYVDFIYDFQKLVYRGFALSYLIHFPSLIRHLQPLWKEFNDETFQHRLKTKITHEKEVQDVFNEFMKKHHHQTSLKSKHGKIVIYDDAILRFPQKTFEYFKRAKTLILWNSGNMKIKEKHNIPAVNLRLYSSETKQAANRLIKEAKLKFYQYRHHFLYSDEKFQSLLLKKLVQSIQSIEQCKAFLAKVSVSCIVVSGTHNETSRILSLCAAEKGIPTICMQHGIIANGFGYLPKIATINAVYGKFEVDWYTERGSSRESLAIVGHPRFDQAFQKRNISRTKFHRMLAIDRTKKTLLIIVRGNRDRLKWQMFIQTISKKLDINIIIKDSANNMDHPLLKEFPFVQTTKGLALYDILHNVDYVVSYPSTVGLEALLVNKPTFILKKFIPNDTGYFEALYPFIEKNPHKLAEIVIRYVHDETYRRKFSIVREKFLAIAYPVKSLSSQRLINLINEHARY